MSGCGMYKNMQRYITHTMTAFPFHSFNEVHHLDLTPLLSVTNYSDNKTWGAWCTGWSLESLTSIFSLTLAHRPDRMARFRHVGKRTLECTLHESIGIQEKVGALCKANVLILFSVVRFDLPSALLCRVVSHDSLFFYCVVVPLICSPNDGKIMSQNQLNIGIGGNVN